MGNDLPRLKRRHPVLRVIGVILAVVVALAVIVAGLGIWTVTRSFPQTSGTHPARRAVRPGHRLPR